MNLGNGPWRLTGLDDPVRFDLDADGTAEVLDWTAAGTELAFVALDRNGNGIIDDGTELFGTAAPGGEATNGFEALQLLDGNGDGSVDGNDAAWSQLLLWTDSDHDGVSDPAELLPIAASPLYSLGLRYHETGRHDPHGNAFRFEALVRGTGGARPYYDVFFRIDR